jgi:type IV secretion system protein VirB6/type IV secretion system protein TrbL
VLGIAIQLMTMILLVGIGKTFLDDYYTRMAAGIELKEMAVLMVASLVLFILVNKVPQLMSSIASSNVGMSGLGSYGSGSALAAVGMAGAAAGVGASMMAAGAANIAGGASAIKAAFSQASANVSSGSDVMAKAAGASGGGSGGGGASTASNTPFAQAAGLNATGGGGSDASAGGNSNGEADGGTGMGEASASPSSAGEGGQGQAGDAASSMGGRAASAAAKAGRTVADAGANLATGTWDTAKAAVSSRMEQFGQRIAETTGGKVAQAIHERGAATAETPTFSGDGFAATPAQSTDPEVAAFVKRGNSA